MFFGRSLQWPSSSSSSSLLLRWCVAFIMSLSTSVSTNFHHFSLMRISAVCLIYISLKKRSYYKMDGAFAAVTRKTIEMEFFWCNKINETILPNSFLFLCVFALATTLALAISHRRINMNNVSCIFVGGRWCVTYIYLHFICLLFSDVGRLDGVGTACATIEISICYLPSFHYTNNKFIAWRDGILSGWYSAMKQ